MDERRRNTTTLRWGNVSGRSQQVTVKTCTQEKKALWPKLRDMTFRRINRLTTTMHMMGMGWLTSCERQFDGMVYHLGHEYTQKAKKTSTLGD